MGQLHMQHIQPPTFPITLNFCSETNQDFCFFPHPCNILREAFCFYGKLSHKIQTWNRGTDTLEIVTIPSGSIALVTSHPLCLGQYPILHQAAPHLGKCSWSPRCVCFAGERHKFIFVSPVKWVSLGGSASTHLLK